MSKHTSQAQWGSKPSTRPHVEGNFVWQSMLATPATLAIDNQHTACDISTGLVDCQAFESRLHRAVNNAASGINSHALLYMDLDDFRHVNETYGDAVGDALLQNIAVRFRSIVHERDVLASFSGDELLLLLEHCDLVHAIKTARLLRQSLAEVPLYWCGEVIKTDMNIGIVVINQNSYSPERLILHASAACYSAKKEGTGQIRVFLNDQSASTFATGEA